MEKTLWPPYVPLWCKSNFSFLEGASHPEELIEEAHALGLRSLALTDRDGVYGVVRAYMKAKELGMHLIIGAEITVSSNDSMGSSTCVLLVMNRVGYANLCRLISIGRLRQPKGKSRVTWVELCERSEGLIALWGGDQSLIVRRETPHEVIALMREAFGDRLYVMVSRHHREGEICQEECARYYASRYRIPLIAAIEVLYHTPTRRELQDVVTCIKNGVTLATAGRLTKPNAEHTLKTIRVMGKLFLDELELIERTREVASRCAFTLSELRYRYPAERLPGGKTSTIRLKELTLRGARDRFGHSRHVPPMVYETIDKELSLIDELDYGGYFLTMWDIVQFCRQKEILCQGRGSAANSVVCFCLGITAVDPMRIEMLFERFLSRERNEPPDIDLDIMHTRREEVIQHVYQKYGRDHAAMVANVVRYRGRSAVRSVGKVFGLSETSLDRLVKMLSFQNALDSTTITDAGCDLTAPVQKQFMKLCKEIQNVPRHLSIHPGGFLLGHEPVHDLVPIENATMVDRTVIQWDKHDLADLGLFKVDLLGLGALTQLDLSFQLLDRHYGKKISFGQIPEDDPSTYDQICKSDTVGVFQLESRAQMVMLPRLKPRCYYDLVIEIGIIRPGPITGGMVHPYLRRRNGDEPVVYPHARLQPVLSKTLGVPLFQEQVMKLAVEAADYTPGEADQLRRDMAAWHRSGRIERHHERIVTRMMENGIEKEFAEQVFDQIRGFGEYGFPESHAASFALLAYATAWIRRHYQDIFTCSLLNAQPMGFYTPATIIDDARRHGIDVRPIDVTTSDWDCTLEPTESCPDAKRTHEVPCRSKGSMVSLSDVHRKSGQPRFAVRMGFRYVKNLSEDRDWRRIRAARAQKSFSSIQDFSRRTKVDGRVLRQLAEADAFAELEEKRRVALWDAQGCGKDLSASLSLKPSETLPGFKSLNAFETIEWDYRSSGHSVHGHPLLPFREFLTAQKIPDAQTVASMPDGRQVRYVGFVICRQQPGTASGVVFMTLEDETGFVNIVIWKQVFDDYAVLARTASFLGVSGKLQVKFGVVHIVADKFWIPQVKAPYPLPGSRNFH